MDLDSEIAREGGEKGREGEERAAGVFFYKKKIHIHYLPAVNSASTSVSRDEFVTLPQFGFYGRCFLGVLKYNRVLPCEVFYSIRAWLRPQ